MRSDAEAHAEEDKKKLTEIESRNILDNRLYQVEKLIADNREKLSESDTMPVEEALAAAKSALASGTLSQIQAATQQLENASHKLAEVLYKSSPPSHGTPGGPGAPADGDSAGGRSGAAPPPEGEVIDAEYVDVDESKKPN
jgi:molecular chaperone DnaK